MPTTSSALTTDHSIRSWQGSSLKYAFSGSTQRLHSTFHFWLITELRLSLILLSPALPSSLPLLAAYEKAFKAKSFFSPDGNWNTFRTELSSPSLWQHSHSSMPTVFLGHPSFALVSQDHIPRVPSGWLSKKPIPSLPTIPVLCSNTAVRPFD